MGAEQKERTISESGFVGREEELKAIDNKVAEGLAGYPITQPFIAIEAPPGYGKSALMAEIAIRYQDGSSLPALDYPVNSKGQKHRVVVFSADCSSGEMDSITQKLANGLKDITQPDKTEETLGITGVSKQILSLIAGDVLPIFLLDNFDGLPRDTQRTFEDILLEPVMVRDGAVVITCARHEVQIQSFAIRQRMINWQLDGLSEAETRKQLETYPVGSKFVYDITHGHPLANKVLALHLTGCQPNNPDNSMMVAEAINCTIEEVFFNEGAEEGLREKLELLSVLRKFNYHASRRFVGSTFDEEKSDGYYNKNLFEPLEDRALARWSTAHRGYVIVPALRSMMEKIVQLEEPEKYVDRHEKAAQYYYELVDYFGRNPDEDVFIEYLYHLCCAGRSKEEILSIIDTKGVFMDKEGVDTTRLDVLYRPINNYYFNGSRPGSSGWVSVMLATTGMNIEELRGHFCDLYDNLGIDYLRL